MYLQAIYELIIDGTIVKKNKNTKPTPYENVKVWVAEAKHYPASKARIKELKYEQKMLLSYTEGRLFCKF